MGVDLDGGRYSRSTLPGEAPRPRGPHLTDAGGRGALVLIIGRGIGITAPAPAERLCCQLICLAIINLAVLGAQLLASARTENQLGPLALGLAGILLSTFSQVMPLWARFLSPWTAYGLIVPADFVGPTLVDLDCHLVNLIVLAGIGGAVFLAITARFDRREI